MKIRELYIDGFGHFHDQRIGPFTSPVVVLHGPNEAGKTTLLQFMRTILFGFPLRNRDKHYAPLADGRHGGRITITDDAGSAYLIERYVGPKGGSVRLRDDSGVQLEEALLAKLLGNAFRDMFTNVFAFSLAELQTDNLLKDAHINGQIYSAGLGAAKLPEACKTLKARRESLFLSGGRKQIVSGLIAELQEVDHKLNEMRGHALEYGRLVARRESIDKELDRMQAEHGQRLVRLGEVNKLEEAWEDWIDLVDAEDRLMTIPQFDGFPSDPLVRLESAEQKVRVARDELQEAVEQLDQAEAAANAMIQDEALLVQREAIVRINRGRNAFDGSIRDLPERKAELCNMEKSLACRLRNLGADWDEERLESFDLSLTFRDQIAHWQQRLFQSQEQVREARTEKVRAEQQLTEQQEIESDVLQSMEAAEQPALTSSQLDERRAALRMSRTRRGEYERIRQRLADLQYQLASLTHEATALQRPMERLSLRPQVLIALSGFVFLGLGVLLGTNALILGAIVAAAAFGIAMYLFIRSRRAQPAVQNTQIRSLQNLVQNASNEEVESKSLLQEAARPLVLDLPDAVALDGVEAELDAQERSLQQWNALNERLQEAARNVQRQERRLVEAEQRLHQVEATYQQDQETWKQWLAEYTLPTTIMPETMHELIGQVEAARVELERVNGMRHRVAAIEVDIQEYHDIVRPLSDKYSISIETDDASQIALVADMLITRFEAARDAVTQRDAAKEEAEQARRTYARRNKQLEEAEEELQRLLRAAGAESTEVFRFKAAQYAERMKLEGQRYECQRRLQRLSGPGESFERFRMMLSQTSKQSIIDELQQLSEQSRTLEEQRRAFLEERGSVDTLLQQLSDEKEASALRVQRNILLEKLHEAAREWSKLRLAEELLHRARLKFEKERQPGVIQHAQKFFTIVTNQRYERLYAPIGEQTITVIDKTGGEKYPSDLSRGTCEQLYLALRFGLIREFGEHAESLPVIVDEILVNFDPARAQRAVQAFADLSQTNQVLVFTCHPSMMETFTSACANTQIINVGSE